MQSEIVHVARLLAYPRRVMTHRRDGIEAAVLAVFADIAGRAPTETEQAEWSAKLSRGVPVRALRAALAATPMLGAAGGDIQTLRRSGLFDAAWYTKRYPDIGQAGIVPELHYVEYGWREDRSPNPYFDPAWYRATHRLPADEHPLFHYLSVGEKQGLCPSPKFDPAWYRSAYGLDAGQSPLADFLRRRHDRTVAPSAAAWPALCSPKPGPSDTGDDVFLAAGDVPADVMVLRGTGLFDENYYALHSGDVLAAGADLLAHYCEFGWREQRQPNFYFDSRWYTATNPEVSRLGVNPLAHYLLAGEPAGRRPIVFFDPVWYRKTFAVPRKRSALGHFLSHRRDGIVSPNEYFDPAWYAARKGETIRAGRDPFARFLMAGLTEDDSPSPAFDLAAWRRKTRGRVSRHFRHLLDPAQDNPLVDFLLRRYR